VPLTLGTWLPVAGYARNVPIQYIHKVAKVQQKNIFLALGVICTLVGHKIF